MQKGRKAREEQPRACCCAPRPRRPAPVHAWGVSHPVFPVVTFLSYNLGRRFHFPLPCDIPELLAGQGPCLWSVWCLHHPAEPLSCPPHASHPSFRILQNAAWPRCSALCCSSVSCVAAAVSLGPWKRVDTMVVQCLSGLFIILHGEVLPTSRRGRGSPCCAGAQACGPQCSFRRSAEEGPGTCGATGALG